MRTSSPPLFRNSSALCGRTDWRTEDEVLSLASRIRARSRAFRTPDAIHLATAEVIQADLFLTADRRLVAYKGVTVADALRDTLSGLDR